MIYMENYTIARETGTERDRQVDFTPQTVLSDVLTLKEADDHLGAILIFLEGYTFKEGPMGLSFELIQEPTRAGANYVADVVRFSCVCDDPANQVEHDADWDEIFERAQALWEDVRAA